MLGSLEYSSAMKIQEAEKQSLLAGKSSGCILFLEHNPPVITLGRRCGTDELLLSEELIKSSGYAIARAERGGLATVHEPGQLVIYLVLPVKPKAVSDFVLSAVLPAAEALSESFESELHYSDENPGIWHKDKKCASVGFDLRHGVSSHGIAVNICNSMKGFSFINPCGQSAEIMTSISEICGRDVSVKEAVDILLPVYKNKFSG